MLQDAQKYSIIEAVRSRRKKRRKRSQHARTRKRLFDYTSRSGYSVWIACPLLISTLPLRRQLWRGARQFARVSNEKLSELIESGLIGIKWAVVRVSTYACTYTGAYVCVCVCRYVCINICTNNECHDFTKVFNYWDAECNKTGAEGI